MKLIYTTFYTITVYIIVTHEPKLGQQLPGIYFRVGKFHVL
jgi:hypothetical protein